MRLIFFEKCSKFDGDFRNPKSNRSPKKILVLEIVAFELVTLTTHLYEERILVIWSQNVNKQFQNFSY